MSLRSIPLSIIYNLWVQNGLGNVHQGTIFDDGFKVEVESTIKEHEMLFKPLVSHVPEEDDDYETLAQ